MRWHGTSPVLCLLTQLHQPYYPSRLDLFAQSKHQSQPLHLNPNTFYASLSLDRSRRDIGLLEIIEIFTRIQDRLIVVSLRDAPDYCAFSYVWGDPSARQDILVNDLPVSVTKSLADRSTFCSLETISTASTIPAAFTYLFMISEHLQPGWDYDVAVAMLESLESTYDSSRNRSNPSTTLLEPSLDISRTHLVHETGVLPRRQ